MIIQPIKTRVFQEGDDLFAFITDYFKKLSEKSVIVVTSKIVALAEKTDGCRRKHQVQREVNPRRKRVCHSD